MKPVIVHQDQEFYSQKNNSLVWFHRRRIMSVFMLVSDLLCIFMSIGSALLIWQQVRVDLTPDLYQSLILPASSLFIAIYLSMGLYPGIGVGPVEELRRMSIGTSLGLLALMGLSFYLRNINMWSRAVFGLTWLFLLISAPLSRKIFRRLAVQLGMWGVPVAVFGETDGASAIYKNLRRNQLAGLWPVLCVKADSISRIFPSPSNKEQSLWDGREFYRNIDIAIIVPQKAPLGAMKKVLLDKTHRFKRIIVMFDEARMGSVWFTPLHLVEHFGLEVTHQLINPAQRIIKRLLDITLILIALPFLVPLFALIAIAIKIDSPGPIFYSQRRVGYGGKEICIWKFRSMVSNADRVLNAYLTDNPEMRIEWQNNFKLKRDPRITRVGNFLRRTSLDELPQLLNVFRQEMSLIGPRPIVEDEILLYGDEFEIYKQVLPGLTGMWQISGRNDLSYNERVNLDVYYVQNWSVWLDFHILLHTGLIALQGRGAY